jgi:uncharacterized protein with von Willebrand factor type A (vWA) domain
VIESLELLVTTLRAAGVQVSPAETIDAARALTLVDVSQREDVRLALRATLAKTREDAGRFDRVFAALTAVPRDAGRRRRRQRGRSSDGAGRGGPQPGTEPSRSKPAPLSGTAPSRAAAQEEAQSPRARRLRPGRLVVLSRRHPDLRLDRPAEEPRPAARPAAPRQAAVPQSAAGRRRAAPLPPMQATPLRRMDITARLSREDEERLARELPRLIREIRLRASRRWRRARGGRPWIARVMRANVGTGGVPFLIPMRRRRPRRPRVLVLVDVSWSALRASTLFLRLALGFMHEEGRARVWLFVDRSLDATEPIAGWLRRPGEAIAGLLDRVPGLDPRAASDYGRAFYQAARARQGLRAAAGRDSIMVVLGDARGNWTDPQAWAFEQLAQACRRVIWLVPEPAARWDTGDSALSEYLPWCDVVCEASDLDGLARGVAEIVRSL